MYFIDKKIREMTFPTTATLARDYVAEFGKSVDPRTIASDIAEMRESLKAPIKYNTENRGYCYTDPAYTLASLEKKMQYVPLVA